MLSRILSSVICSLVIYWTCYKSYPLICRQKSLMLRSVDKNWIKRARGNRNEKKRKKEEEGGGRDLSGTFIRNEAALFYAFWWTRFCLPPPSSSFFLFFLFFVSFLSSRPRFVQFLWTDQRMRLVASPMIYAFSV